MCDDGLECIPAHTHTHTSCEGFPMGQSDIGLLIDQFTPGVGADGRSEALRQEAIAYGSDAPHGPCCATRLRHQVPAAEVGPSTAERGLGLHSAAAHTWGYPELKNKKALAQPGARGAQRSTVPSDVCTYPQATALKRDAAHGGGPPWALMQPAARFGRHSWQEDLGRRRRIGAGARGGGGGRR